MEHMEAVDNRTESQSLTFASVVQDGSEPPSFGRSDAAQGSASIYLPALELEGLGGGKDGDIENTFDPSEPMKSEVEEFSLIELEGLDVDEDERAQEAPAIGDEEGGGDEDDSDKDGNCEQTQEECEGIENPWYNEAERFTIDKTHNRIEEWVGEGIDVDVPSGGSTKGSSGRPDYQMPPTEID